MPLNLNFQKICFRLFMFAVLILFGFWFLKFGISTKVRAAASDCFIPQNGIEMTCYTDPTFVQCYLGTDHYCCYNQADCIALQSTQPTCGDSSSPGGTCQTTSTVCVTDYPGQFNCPTGQKCSAQCAAQYSSSSPIPPHNPTPLPCSAIGDPEFHSLRPYQASPCKPDLPPTAKFCGNELIFHDVIPETYPGGGTCVDDGTKVTCTYKEGISKKLIIDLSVANLPIMGNTEDVLNSQSATESLSDTDKMNKYVSWYLNGVTQRSEYGDIKNTASNAANLSGPLKKLLPSVMLDAQRIQSINNAKVSNHDQIVVCMESNVPIIGNLLKIGYFTPVPCYTGNNTGAQKVVLRLKSSGTKYDGWDGQLSLFNGVVNGLSSFIPTPNITLKLLKQSLLTAWNKKTPPLPWDDGTDKPFASEDLYSKAYNEWRGKACVIVPIINKVVCFENIFVPNYYAELYSYVPLSSTEDLKGSVEIDNPPTAINSSVGGVSLSDISFDKQTPSTLFFSHMQESADLADALQNTFVSSSEQGNKKGPATNVAPPASCTMVDVRTNKGDSLFATDLTGTLNYTAEFSCIYNSISTCSGSCNLPNERECDYAGGLPGTGSCVNGRFCCNLPGTPPPPPPTQDCQKDVYIGLSTTSKTPLVEDIWSQLVAGPQSIFKRIFPKTNTPGSVGQIKDIPGSTTIKYTLEGLSQQTTDLKFPHIGSISEYFLKGIQTALRPKGYGEPISFDLSNNTSTTSGEINCNKSAPESGFTKILDKQAYLQLALNWVSGKTGNHVLECYNDTVYRAKQAGVNVAMTLALWLHESDASNYSLGYLQDFGAYWPGTFPGYNAQITEFLRRAKNPNIYYKSGAVCNNRADVKDDFMAWALVYKSGKCDPNEPGAKKFYTDMMTAIDWVSDCPTPTSPIDTSCP